MSDTTCLDPAQSNWMLSGGKTPCQIAESIVQVCASTAAVQHLSIDLSCSALGTSTTSPCCCSTVTYALVAACWVCQTSQTPTQLKATYRTWLAGCSAPLTGSSITLSRPNYIFRLPSVVTTASPSIPVPSWALVQPEDTNAPWNISLAQRTAGYTPSSTLNSTTSASTSPLPPPPTKRSPPPYGPIAIITSLVITFLLLGMALWLYRRRNRVSPSRAEPGFEIDGTDQYTPRDTPKSWAWWTRKLRGHTGTQTSASDPGKIDAWRYPFDYTPVHMSDTSGGSSAGGGGVQGYYDPYNPNRTTSNEGRRRGNSESRGATASADSMGVRGQGSSGTLYQNYSSAPGYTSTPGYTTAGYSTPGYTAPPPGLGYTSSAPGPGYTSSGYTTPTQGARPQLRTPTHPYPPYNSSQPMPPGYTHTQTTTTTYQSPAAPAQGQITPYPYPHPYPQQPSTGTRTQTATSPLSPHSARTHTHSHTFELRLSPEQYAELRNMYPEIRVRTKRRRRRRDREADGAVVSPDAERRGSASGGGARPRSWSVPPPVQVEHEEEQERDGRPRNGVELNEKYTRGRRRRRGAESDTEGLGGTGGSGAGVTHVHVHSRRNSGVGREREVPRALDGGVSLMGGPPPRR